MNLQKKRILILGANSDIAKALCVQFAKAGANLHLASRNVKELEKSANDLRIRYGVEVNVSELDALIPVSRTQIIDNVYPQIDGAVLALGVLGSQTEAQKSEGLREQVLQTNFNVAIHLLEPLAALFEQRRAGFVVGISSVAGDRGRASNYMYGAAKAGFSAYLSGLRNRLASFGVPVLTIKPGFVKTKMTLGLPLPGKLVATPERVAADIMKALAGKKDVSYTPWFWKPLMTIIIHIPERIFKGLKL